MAEFLDGLACVRNSYSCVALYHVRTSKINKFYSDALFWNHSSRGRHLPGSDLIQTKAVTNMKGSAGKANSF